MFRSALKETPIKQRRPIRVNVETGVMPCCNRCSPNFVYDKIVSSADFYQHCDIVLSSILLFILNLFWSWINICFIYCFKKKCFLKIAHIVVGCIATETGLVWLVRFLKMSNLSFNLTCPIFFLCPAPASLPQIILVRIYGNLCYICIHDLFWLTLNFHDFVVYRVLGLKIRWEYCGTAKSVVYDTAFCRGFIF